MDGHGIWYWYGGNKCYFFLASGRDTIGYGMVMTVWGGFICVYYYDLNVLVMAQP
jgi:hypothetical protein